MRAKLIRQVGETGRSALGRAARRRCRRGEARRCSRRRGARPKGAGRPGEATAAVAEAAASSTLVPNLAQRGPPLAPQALAPTTVAPSCGDSGAGADLTVHIRRRRRRGPARGRRLPLRMGTGTATFMGTYPLIKRRPTRTPRAKRAARLLQTSAVAADGRRRRPPPPPPPTTLRATRSSDVYDGHGKHGHLVSNFVRQRLAEALRTIPRSTNPAAAERALAEAHRKTNDALKASGIDVTVSGVNGVTALKRGRHLHVLFGTRANVLGRVDERRGGVVATPASSHDHKPDSERERKRIEGGGGYVAPSRMPGVAHGRARGWDRTRMFGLATSRSMGDTVYVGPNRSGVIAEPEVTSHRLDANDRYVIFGTDGVWDHVTSQEAVEIARRHPNPQKASEAIAQCARERWRRNGPMQDDITAVVVGLASEYVSK